jgi:hypothetical protein
MTRATHIAVLGVRRRVSAVIVAATMVLGAGTGSLAATASGSCASCHRPCDAPEQSISCCCGHASERSTPAPTQTWDFHGQALATTATSASAVAVVRAARPSATQQTFPLRGSPPDLPTLYSALLI